MTAATIDGNLYYVDFRAARTVTVPRKRRAVWHWPWWWPAALRAGVIRCERKLDALLAAVENYAECPS